MKVNSLNIFFLFGVSITIVQGQQCFDRKGKPVEEGEQYLPKADDACYTCTCIGGEKSMCLTSLCDAPKCPNYRNDPDKCCGYICTNPDGTPVSESEMGSLSVVAISLTGGFLAIGIIAVSLMTFFQWRRANRLNVNTKEVYDFYASPPPPYSEMEKVPDVQKV